MASTDELARGRSVAYHLLASLFLRRNDAEVESSLETFSDLVASRPTDLEFAVEHERVFGFNVFPYEGVFRNLDGRVGGDAGNLLLERYVLADFAFEWSGESPDHIGVELACLSHLTELESSASAHPAAVKSLRREQHRLIQFHVLRWLPALVWSIKRQGFAFLSTAAAIALELVRDHDSELRRSGSSALGQVIDPPGSVNAPSAAQLLETPETGLSEIVRHLLIPARSGLFLSRGDIMGLARAHSVPSGFGERHGMFLDLIRSVIAAGRLSDLLSNLDGIVSDASASYGKPSGEDRPGSWVARLNDTRVLFSEIGRRSESSFETDPSRTV